ncbi:hypothetical protein BABINDRAFT_163049 [Babjeviella inositovora NRRL Y-12698]|uniref:HRQ family protein 1 n=1 Tax=Babjeviella inositovora NRRL Y-12698 TaxID=984486 RepID=A0A1E3QK24_9ASCO|nr:uncharacterized protein BABINDRAFT_163049 [Babjeviella inositovora NRRL Y-12698]ODQ78000.1 hypothetical protein BABINDRAFT_163049 [Babjeviella inositovora NRRL Y-12698]
MIYLLVLAMLLWVAYYRTHLKPSPSKATPKKKLFAHDANEPIPEPTPLRITPDDVREYDDRPWRPFRWPYHQTMSIYKLPINHWLDMDKYYWHYIEEKKRILHQYGDENISWLPESHDACVELMETVRTHMLKRYPLLFESSDGGVTMLNKLTGEHIDMSEPLQHHPLVYVSKMAKEDFYIVQQRDDGKHYLVAACVAFPGGSFGIKGILGTHLDHIHELVPFYETKLKPSMERWFGKMEPADLVERGSWYITWDHKLFRNNIYALKEGKKVHSGIPPTEFNVRVDRQTLRRLPRTRAIVFTAHPLFYSIEEMKDEPMVPSLLRKIIYEAPESIIRYKSFYKLRDHISHYLDGLVARQVELGLIEADAEVRTLPTYPFAHFIGQQEEIYGWRNPSESRAENYEEKAKAEIGPGD